MISHFPTDISEAVRPDNHTRMEDDFIAYRYAVFKENVRVNNAIAADRYIVTNLCAGTNLRSRSDA